MTQAELFALMDRFDQSGLWELCYRTGEEKITLRKGPAAPLPPVPPAAAPMAPAAPAVQNAAPAAPAPAPEKEGKEVTAPLVGTFYVAPAPGEDVYKRQRPPFSKAWGIFPPLSPDRPSLPLHIDTPDKRSVRRKCFCL